ncbi:MAG: HlyD family efflux transporter periplasmic adaptor subunit [Clostridia bacterium]|nr:HlyD family efflux transporter periplasmic adaptor subunit [Clostridia bacterium]
MKKLFLCLMLIAVTTGSALCEGNTSLTGVVAATDVERITAPYAGEVITLLFREGDAVTAGMEAATMSPNYVLAPCSGTVTLFASQGDDASDVQLIYGALACVEPDASYTVAAEILMDSCLPQNQLVHPGETVYLCCTNDGSHNGKGIVTSVTGSSFTVLVTEGDFLFGEAVDICRRGDCMGDDCIGSGLLSRIDPLTCAGEGLVISEFVGNGDHVEAGEVLYELAPTWDAHFVMHETSGVVAEVCVREGDWVEAGETLALVWPDEAMHIIVDVPESLLDDYELNTSVRLMFTDGREAEGRVVWMSMIPDSSAGASLWKMHIAFEYDAEIKYGMSVEVQPMHEENDICLIAS